MSTLVTVRPVAPADFDKWLPLWQGYNLFYGRPSLPAEITQMTWSRLFDAYEPVYALVAERNMAATDVPDVPIKTTNFSASCTIFPSQHDSHCPCLLSARLVHDRGGTRPGRGPRFDEGVYDRARLAGSPRVYWQTHETNSTAMHLYDKVAERSGFVVYRHQV